MSDEGIGRGRRHRRRWKIGFSVRFFGVFELFVGVSAAAVLSFGAAVQHSSWSPTAVLDLLASKSSSASDEFSPIRSVDSDHHLQQQQQQQYPLPRQPFIEEESMPYFAGDSANVSRLIENLLKGYDKRLRPNYKGIPVEVTTTMFIISVSSISEVDMDFTLDFYFRQHWQDDRLVFAEAEEEEELCISNEMLAKIWWPDTFFANARSARFHTATTKNAFLRINPNGFITLSLRLTVTAMCRMDLTFFPLDTQICPLEIESYAYSVKHIAYKWKEGPTGSVTIDRGVQLPQFKVAGYRIRERLEVLTTGNYSRLACELYFVRSLGYYVIHIYIPSSLIVVLSWVSFWLHRDAAPARVALGVTTVLTMTTLISSTNAALPKISYLKSIDVYLVTCFVMVFAAILEYAAVSYIGRTCWPVGRWSRRKESDLGEWAGEEEAAYFRLRKGRKGDNRWRTHLELEIKGARLASHKDANADLYYLSPVVTPEGAAILVPTHQSESDTSLHNILKTRTMYDKKRQPKLTSSKASKRRNTTLADNIDIYSRVVFPGVFAALSTLYWVVYLSISPSVATSSGEFVFI